MMTVYMSNVNKQNHLNDNDLDEFYQEAKKINPKLYIDEYHLLTKRFLRKKKRTKLYSVFYDLGLGEFQEINFKRLDDGACTIYTQVKKDVLFGYLMGLLHGNICDSHENKEQENDN